MTNGEPSRRSALAAALLAALAVAPGCARNAPPSGPACPPVRIVDDASSLTAFGAGPGRDLVDVDFEAVLYDVASGCMLEDTGTLVVAVAPNIAVTRGPANDSRRAVFEYFVSVVDGERTVRSKELFAVGAEFEGNRNRVTFRDDDPPVTINIPNVAAADGAYQIFVGLQLTPEQLDYNRGRPAPGR